MTASDLLLAMGPEQPYANADICTTEQTLSITHLAMEIPMSEIFELPETKAPVNKPQAE